MFTSFICQSAVCVCRTAHRKCSETNTHRNKRLDTRPKYPKRCKEKYQKNLFRLSFKPDLENCGRLTKIDSTHWRQRFSTTQNVFFFFFLEYRARNASRVNMLKAKGYLKSSEDQEEEEGDCSVARLCVNTRALAWCFGALCHGQMNPGTLPPCYSRWHSRCTMPAPGRRQIVAVT